MKSPLIKPITPTIEPIILFYNIFVTDNFKNYCNNELMVTEIDKSKFAATLHQLLDNRGVAVRGRARYLNETLNLGLSDKACKKWLDGETFPTLDKLFIISNFFNFSVDELIKTGEIRSLDSTFNSLNNVFESNGSYTLDSRSEKQYIVDCIKGLDANESSEKILLDTLLGVVRLAFDDNAKVTNDYIKRNPCRRMPDSPLRGEFKDSNKVTKSINKYQ